MTSYQTEVDARCPLRVKALTTRYFNVSLLAVLPETLPDQGGSMYIYVVGNCHLGWSGKF